MRRSLLVDHLSAPNYLQSLADAIIVRLACVFVGDTDTRRPREALSPGRLASLVRHIDSNLGETVRVDELARMAGLTRSHFSRAFIA
jgi:transcriptional regulator GlxA family with amidase domain